ncbi:hypothetical protein AABB24_034336 [Solanum stoloniferum]|uniref:MADS-box domain-containing protein n=1 Tax=Solanum stoloniferum TaxID=62892 RepID=A0ABD2RHA9_9SOLN
MLMLLLSFFLLLERCMNSHLLRRNNTTYQEEKRKEMGRGKIEIKRIENSSNRHVTYSKRRNGILKKAKEISVLCDAHVSVIIFATSGKMHEFSSTPLVDILDQYHKLTGRRLWDAKHESRKTMTTSK